MFEIFIQSGAMLAIVWEYRQRFARVIGGLATDPARAALRVQPRRRVRAGRPDGPRVRVGDQGGLFAPVPVAIAFIVGAFVILWVERRQRARPASARVAEVDDMTTMDALKVGIAQCFALIPGTSRSGATIIGGMLFGLSRKAATEFSFFLAVPTLVAAGAYSMWKSRALLDVGDLPAFGVGFVASFFAAFVCVRWLIRWVAHHDFVPFAWYRIAFGVVILATAWTGVVQWR